MCITLPCGYSSQTLAKFIAYCEIVVYILSLLACSFFATILESSPDLLRNVANEKSTQDFLMFLELPHPLQTFLILWICMSSVAGLIFSFILLRGAQERNLSKVKMWFVITIVGYVIWLPMNILWISQSFEPLNIAFSTMMSYMFGGLCLWVVYTFMEELRIENISHRPGFKTTSVSFCKI